MPTDDATPARPVAKGPHLFGPPIPRALFGPNFAGLSEPPLGLQPDRPANRLQRMEWIAPLMTTLARIATRRATTPPPPAPPDHDDPEAWRFGPAHQHRRGRLETVEVPDPDRPKDQFARIRRARVKDPIGHMDRGDLHERRRFRAAQRFRADVEAAAGGLGSCIAPKIVGASPGSTLPALWRAVAADEVGRFARIVGARRLSLLAWVLLDRRGVKAWCDGQKLRHAWGYELLRDGLDALADYYGIELRDKQLDTGTEQ